MSENTINTAVLGELPGTMLGIVRDKALDSGVLPQLSPEKPTIFGPVKGATFTGVPRAKIVGESERKPAGEKPKVTPWKAEPLKIVTQIRVSDEFMWADSDYRLGVMSDLIAPALGASIGRAVDLIAFHGINPATGAASDKATKHLSQATSTVTANGEPTSPQSEAMVVYSKRASPGTVWVRLSPYRQGKPPSQNRTRYSPAFPHFPHSRTEMPPHVNRP